jgi:hypothetical protein
MADYGNKIIDYIARIASASSFNNNALANIRDNTKSKDTQLKAMSAQLKILANTVAILAKSIKPNNENRNPNIRSHSQGQQGSSTEQLTKLCNMGGYCHTHGYHPLGKKHDSKTCSQVQERDHRNDATFNNCLNGNVYCPAAICVAVEQQNHSAWKDKSKPS